MLDAGAEVGKVEIRQLDRLQDAYRCCGLDPSHVNFLVVIVEAFQCEEAALLIHRKGAK